MEYKTIQLVREEPVGIIYLNQPESRNALSLQMRDELRLALESWAVDAGIKAIIIGGRGTAFCAGGDLRTMGNFKPAQGRNRMQAVHRLIMTLRNLEKPVVAAVNGPAFGAGWSLALACDMVVASEKASFSMAFVKVGLVPDCGCMYLLPRLIGLFKAKELMMTGRVMDVTEAVNLGLVNKVVPPDQLLDTAMEMARELAQGPPLAIGLLKSIVNRAQEIDFLTLLEEEALVQDLCFQTEDHREGIRTFFQKGKPRFVGR
ncbi:MAG: enoyl-CoA hydratase [Firmicutes bacterium]|nr:enoyl-CoA hydratase [Bacillota bacterium]